MPLTDTREQRIAEWCGWSFHPTAGRLVLANPWKSPNGKWCACAPAYLTSLDACREFENRLDHLGSGWLREYATALVSVCKERNFNQTQRFTILGVRATPRQRVDALLIVIGEEDDGRSPRPEPRNKGSENAGSL